MGWKIHHAPDSRKPGANLSNPSNRLERYRSGRNKVRPLHETRRLLLDLNLARNHLDALFATRQPNESTRHLEVPSRRRCDENHQNVRHRGPRLWLGNAQRRAEFALKTSSLMRRRCSRLGRIYEASRSFDYARMTMLAPSR